VIGCERPLRSGRLFERRGAETQRLSEGAAFRVPALCVAAILALLAVGAARADGEAGLVIQDGDAVTTYCIAFQGDGINGDALLRAAGQTFDAYGGGSGLAVCSIGARGCPDASSFSSCFCQCQGGDCTYWAFFTRNYGKNWVYSSLAFNLLKAKDGDVHGWKWGKGAPSSAPVPQDVTFEQICGHSPRGGAAPTATAPPPTVALPTNVPSIAGATATAPLATLPATASTEASPSGQPSPVQTRPLVTITNSVPTASSQTTPSTPATAEDDGDSSGAGGLLAFGAVAAVLVAAIGGGLIWRRTHAG
jgi:hypothetical protein